MYVYTCPGKKYMRADGGRRERGEPCFTHLPPRPSVAGSATGGGFCLLLQQTSSVGSGSARRVRLRRLADATTAFPLWYDTIGCDDSKQRKKRQANQPEKKTNKRKQPQNKNTRRRTKSNRQRNMRERKERKQKRREYGQLASALPKRVFDSNWKVLWSVSASESLCQQHAEIKQHSTQETFKT